MATWTGYLDNAGCPRVKVSLYGYNPTVFKEFEVIVDTGFTGFISMPMVEAFPLGLILTGTATTVLADGSQSHKLTALGTAFVEKESKVGVILLTAGAHDILAGMEFLSTFKKTLFVHGPVVLLLDTEVLNQVSQAAAPAPPPSK